MRVRTCQLARTALAMALLCAIGVEAAQSRTLSLAEMSQRAGRVVEGVCSDLEMLEHPVLRRPAWKVHFQIGEILKGDRHGLQELWVLADPAKPLLSLCEAGERVVLFLYEPNALGITSAVGLGQGRFRLREDSVGRAQFTNGRSRLALLGATPSPRAARSGRGLLTIQELREAIQQVAP